MKLKLPSLLGLFCLLTFGFLVAVPHAFAKATVPVLLYHYIGPVPNPQDRLRFRLSVSVEDFERQMAFIRDNNFEPVTLGYLPYALDGRMGPNGGRPVLLTFDDGYMDFYFNAFPILKKYNFHAVEFIPTGKIGGSYYMSWDQIKEIEQSGLVEFEAHSVSHANLTRLSLASLDEQLAESKKTLEQKTGHPVFYLAYPYGLYNGLVLQEAQRLGYVGGFTGANRPASSLSLIMPRFEVGGLVPLARFQAWLLGKR